MAKEFNYKVKEFNCKVEEQGKLFVDEINKETMMFEVSGFNVDRVLDAKGKHAYDAMTIQLSKQDVRSLVGELERWLNAN